MGNLLLEAVEKDSVDDVKCVLEEGVDVNFLNSTGQSALIITMKNKSICTAGSDCTDNMIFHLLLTTGADVSMEDIRANTPIMLATDNSCVHHVKKPTQAGADVNAKITGTSILYCAVCKENIDIIETLINEGAHVNSKTVQGCTALMHAVRNENMICMQMLLKAGAKVRQYDVQGFNTFDFLKSPNVDICNLLYSAREDCMTEGGDSKIVGVENPKDMLNEENSEPGLLLYLCRDQIW